jgi:Tfp pilus assembly protein PilF
VIPEAHELVLRGTYFLYRGDDYKAIDDFQEAIEKDPSYALAHAALAKSYNLLGDHEGCPFYRDFFQG